MARMRRIQVVIDPDLDDRLQREAAARGMSKSALIRVSVERELAVAPENGLRWIGELSALFDDIEPVDDIDEYLYGSRGSEA
jgi:hypothetical protein